MQILTTLTTTATIALFIEPPTADMFPSLDEAEQEIYQHAFDHGYALTRCDIKKDKKGNPRRWDFRYDKGGY